MAVRPQRSLSIGQLAPLALMPAGAFAVHQLRYWLAFGSRAGAELQAQGHSYLHSLVPWIVLFIAVAAGVFLRALSRALSGRCSLPRYTLSFAALWLVCAACLVALYVAQEFLEGLFATGHPGGLIGIFGDAGWWSGPAALAVGLVLATVFHGARWVVREVAERHRRPVGRARRRLLAARLPRDATLPRLAPLSDGWSGRGPPR
jgi:hypothetical protein